MNYRLLLALAAVVMLSGPACAAKSANSTTTAPDSLFTLSWTTDLSGEVNRVRAVDLNGDGSAEVVANSLYIASFGKSGTIYALDGKGQQYWKYLAGLLEDSYTTDSGHTIVGAGPYSELISPSGQELWKRSTRDSPTQNIVAQSVYGGDINGDGKDETLVGTSMGVKGASLVIRDYLGEQIADIVYKGMETPYAMYAADLDGDKRRELMVGSLKQSVNTVGGTYDSAHSKPTTFIVYDAGGAVRWTDNYETAVTAVTACDLNGDGSLEVITGSMGKVTAYDNTGKRLWDSAVEGIVNALDCGSLEGGGKMDVVAVAANTFAIKGDDGKQLWKYASGTANDVRVYDFGDDGKAEVVVGTASIRVLDSTGQQVYRSESFGTITELDLGDLNHDGYMSIVCGSKDHKVRAIDTVRFSQVEAADYYYSLAEKAYSDKDYNRTGYYAMRARDYYEMAGRDTDKAKANTLVDKSGRYSDGDTYYNLSNHYFALGEYDHAIEYADKAVEAYKRVNDLRKLNDLSELKKEAQMIPEAENNMRLARQYFNEKRYANASDYAAKAQNGYGYLKNATAQAEAEGIGNRSRAYIEFMRQMDEANKHIKLNNQGNATYYISLAQKEYLKLNDPALKAEVDNATERANAIGKDKDVLVYGGIGVVALTIALILVALGLIAYYFIKNGGVKALGKMFEDKGPDYDTKKNDGKSGLRGLRGRAGESIGDSYKR
jgi:tetratricopeptide (TPR) repeat protein